MSDQMYVVPPFAERKAERVVKALEFYLEQRDMKYYHAMEAGPEKQEEGMMQHDIRAALSTLKQPNYKKPWSVLGPFFYPKHYNEDGSPKK